MKEKRKVKSAVAGAFFFAQLNSNRIVHDDYADNRSKKILLSAESYQQ
jgi:hypothetical protein